MAGIFNLFYQDKQAETGRILGFWLYSQEPGTLGWKSPCRKKAHRDKIAQLGIGAAQQLSAGPNQGLVQISASLDGGHLA